MTRPTQYLGRSGVTSCPGLRRVFLTYMKEPRPDTGARLPRDACAAASAPVTGLSTAEAGLAFGLSWAVWPAIPEAAAAAASWATMSSGEGSGTGAAATASPPVCSSRCFAGSCEGFVATESAPVGRAGVPLAGREGSDGGGDALSGDAAALAGSGGGWEPVMARLRARRSCARSWSASRRASASASSCSSSLRVRPTDVRPSSVDEGGAAPRSEAKALPSDVAPSEPRPPRGRCSPPGPPAPLPNPAREPAGDTVACSMAACWGVVYGIQPPGARRKGAGPACVMNMATVPMGMTG